MKKGAFTAEWFIISKKKIYKITGSIFALIMIVVLGYGAKWYFENRNPSGSDRTRAARFLTLDGQVTVRRASNNLTVPATRDMELEPGDTIQTSSNSSALVEYEDGSRITIRPGSTIILKEDNKARVVNDLKDGKIKVTTTDGTTTQHIVALPGATKAVVDKASDASIDVSGEKSSIVVGRGFTTVSNAQGSQKLAADQRADIDKGAIKVAQLMPAPKLDLPENAKQFLIEKNAGEINFSWQPVPEADRYRLMISSSISFPEQALAVNIDALGNTKYTWRTPVDGSYFWRVQAINKDGVEGKWSDTPNFSIQTKKQGKEIPIQLKKIEEIHRLLVEIQGTTKPGAMVTINGRLVQIDAAGNFKDNVSFPADVRERTIVIEAKDQNGNTGRKEQRL